MLSLENEVATVENDAISEEQHNADLNYAVLDSELKNIKDSIPFPETKPYTTGSDYESIVDIQYQKGRNRPFWDKQEVIEPYCNTDKLYTGHVTYNGANYYIMENAGLESKELQFEGRKVWLIEHDDRAFADVVSSWKFPKQSKVVNMSRNIIMDNRHVKDVDVKLDKSNELFNDITDAFLRKALIRNKSRAGAQSIIQTIQEKQDAIRLLPKDMSVIVQGCAGSGKTMVLLHRLRYMIFNKDYESHEYLFLVPGNDFKEFISQISEDFKIKKNNIISISDYYEIMSGRKKEELKVCADEMVFEQDYLSRVYDDKFIKECYEELFEFIGDKFNQLISYCETVLTEILEKITNENQSKITELKTEALQEFREATKDVSDFISVDIEGKYDNLSLFLSKLKNEYEAKKGTHSIDFTAEPDYVVAADDYRILSDIKLNQIRKSINDEELALGRSNIFTRGSHRKKLSTLQEIYNNVYEEVVEDIKCQEYEKMRKEAESKAFIFDGVNVIQVKNIIENAENILEYAEKNIAESEKKLDGINDYVEYKYSAEIEELNNLIIESGELAEESKNYVSELLPCNDIFFSHLQNGNSLFNKYITLEKAERKNKVKDDFKIFNERTHNQTEAYLNLLLQNIVKRKIKEEFGTIICNEYKHYWYLNLYCNYLTRNSNRGTYKYIYVDEAQDLSAAEINLITKLNYVKTEDKNVKKPVMNLFGDIRQKVSAQGISDWTALGDKYNICNLNENFRNPNQVIEYCNSHLPFKMETVGVDMKEVSQYENIDEFLSKKELEIQDIVFIVKDEYAVNDLKKLMEMHNISAPDIYTVKDVKGLEFKEVCVFDQKMNDNEKYIAYTRALIKLNVIKSLPESQDDRKSLIIQGEDTLNEAIM